MSCAPKAEAPAESNAQFVKSMGIGWNLGNTLDAQGEDETAWHNPRTTQEIIDMVADKGFKTLRVPITWQNHLDENYNIEKEWLDRVEEVVNYGLKRDMYVIVNIHHDEEIISPSYERLEQSKEVVASIWRQVSERFKGYDNRLIFETLNEMRVKGTPQEWKGGTEENRDCINQLHVAALDAIRSSGENNTSRKVMISTYAASAQKLAMQGLVLPEGDDNLLISVHSYYPYSFCQSRKPNLCWGTAEDKAELDKMFNQIKESFIDRGYSVVLGEWGSLNNNNDAQRAIHAAYYTYKALSHGICPVVWDDGGQFRLLDRHNLRWERENIADAIVKGYNCTDEKEVDPVAQNFAFVERMELGWNLGNTLDAIGDDETAWHNPRTTKAMIDFVRAKGFKTLRVPTTWHRHLGSAPDYKIEKAWLDRVEEVVNYGLDNDMYVILNIHHDESIIEPSYAKLEESKLIVEAIWSQVSERFNKYDDHLIFETLNEMRVKGSPLEWKGGDKEGRECLNKLHVAAINVIRASGGNNSTRKIMVSAYAGSPDKQVIDAVRLPKGDANIIASVHAYTPYDLCLSSPTPQTEWEVESGKADIDGMLDVISERYIEQGVPIVMGEWGTQNRDNDPARARHAAYYAGACLERGICPVVWDDGGQFQLLDRRKIEWKRESIADAIVGAKK